MNKLNIDDLELFELIIDEDDNTEGVFSNSLVSSPAIERGFVWLSSQEIKLESVDTDKRLVAGPILIPNKKILRQDEGGMPYTIFFTPDTIEKMSRKFMKNKYTSEMTIEHGRKKVDGIYLTESWIVESPSKDKSNLYGFTLPKGTWFGIYKIDNDSVWEQVKRGDVKGFSVEMIADHIPSKLKPSKLFSKEIVDLTEVEAQIVLNKIKGLFEGQPSIASSYPGQMGSGSISEATFAEGDLCPEATQNVEVNLKNRQTAIDVAMYGPLDIKNPGDYWKEIGDVWGVDEKTARGETCSNCAAWDITTKILDCIAEGIGTEPSTDPYDVIESGDLGYCTIFKFKCNGNRSCSAHIDGGPVTD